MSVWAAIPHAWIEGGGSPYHENSAFHPVVERLEHSLALGQDDAPDVKIANSRRPPLDCGIALDEGIPLLATLLSVPIPDRYPSLGHLSAEAQRRKTLESLAAWLFAISEDRPVVLLIEDLHWIDPSSLELVQALVGQVPTARVFMILTYRPGVDVSWAHQSHVVHLTLHPLTRKQVATIVDSVTGGKALPSVVLNHVIAKTDGVPLFVEELTKATSSPTCSSSTIESSSAPIRSRDSRFPRPCRIRSTTFSIGSDPRRQWHSSQRSSAASSRTTCSGGDVPRRSALAAALDQLASAELLYRRGTPPRAVYTFKHALVQETAYRSLLKKKCQEYHARIARTLEERFPERVDPRARGRGAALRGGGARRASDSFVRAGGHGQHNGRRIASRSATSAGASSSSPRSPRAPNAIGRSCGCR